MRRSILSTIAVCVFTCMSCDYENEHGSIPFLFCNNCSFEVDIIYPAAFSHSHVPFAWGTMHDVEPGDTTSKTAYKKSFFQVRLISPNNQIKENSGFDTIEEMSPYDTVRMFVFESTTHYRTVEYEKPFLSESYLCRYDLTSKDMYGLMNPNGEIVISFPPSKEMKDVKMFPPYESLIMGYPIDPEPSRF